MIDDKIFEARPGNCAVLLPDFPKFTFVSVTDDFVLSTGIKREDLIGKGLFEMFPQKDGDPHYTGEEILRSSLHHVKEFKKPHLIPRMRYDLVNADGTFLEKYWKVHNVPVLDA